MPSWIDYGLTQNDVGDLINFIRSMNQVSPPSEKSPALTSQVKQEVLCQGCK